MGMLLSRIRAIIVHQDGMRRGDTTSSSLDAVNGYGLHWREELNWRAMGFEFIETRSNTTDYDQDRDKVDTSDDSYGKFHA